LVGPSTAVTSRPESTRGEAFIGGRVITLKGKSPLS
jgi:hypothetical protein